MALIAGSSQLAPADASFLIHAMVVLAFATLFGFFVVWIWRPRILYPPSQFQDETIWLRAVTREVVPSKPLPLPSIVHGSGVGVGTILTTPKGPITPKETDAPYLLQMTGELQGGSVTSTAIMELTAHLRTSSDWDYLTVDVGEGNTWLLSRLFIFVSMYKAIRNLPCVVFVRTQGEKERLLGIAEPGKICTVLAGRCPWFYEILINVLAEKGIPIFISDAMDESAAINVMTDFVQRLQSWDDHTGDPEWSKLSSGGSWEHTRWLDAGMVGLNGSLSSALYDRRATILRHSPGMSDEDLAVEIVGRDAPFVALVGDQDEFRQLYDKRRIFDRVKNRLAALAQAA